MANINTFLLRDTLDDNGGTGHTLFSKSPDLICHPQVLNPAEFFKENYTRDVTQTVDTSSKTNALYVRGKNMSSTGFSGKIQVYRSDMSLFLKPSLWKNNKLKTAPKDGENPLDYIDISAEANGISVGKTPFVLDGTIGNFCLVGMASDMNGPVIPADFTTYDSFIKWVTSNQGVCVRNQNYYSLSQKPNLEIAAEISNPETESKLCTLEVMVEGVPVGVTFGAKNTALSYDKEMVSTQSTDQFASALYIPSGFDGFFTGTVRYSGALPAGAQLSLTIYYGSKAGSEVYHLGYVPETILKYDANNKTAGELLNGQYRLVRLGRCSVRAV
ncbi:MAG: hypothetical protein FWC19_04930 [Treponema sp.]|nr:hypothetical protein [Treponema sp.]MCL2272133.1 hypothetical protein [Treponema sp.]